MHKYIFTSLIICIFFLGTIFSCGNEFLRVKERINIDEAKKIANKALKEKGGNPEKMIIKADKKNSDWKKHVSVVAKYYHEDLIKDLNLEHRDYWAIHYTTPSLPGEYLLGGEAWVLVDSKNGSIIDVIFGE